MNQSIHKGLAFLFIWVVGVGAVSYLLFAIADTDFSHLYSVHEEQTTINTQK